MVPILAAMALDHVTPCTPVTVQEDHLRQHAATPHTLPTNHTRHCTRGPPQTTRCHTSHTTYQPHLSLYKRTTSDNTLPHLTHYLPTTPITVQEDHLRQHAATPHTLPTNHTYHCTSVCTYTHTQIDKCTLMNQSSEHIGVCVVWQDFCRDFKLTEYMQVSCRRCQLRCLTIITSVYSSYCVAL